MSCKRLQTFLRALVLTSACAALLLPSHARAAFYIETGFGAGELRGLEKGYKTTDSSTGMGLGSNFSFASTIGSASRFIQLHLGIQQRLTQA